MPPGEGWNDPIYPIGRVEALTGLTGRQIRYYEKKGLLHPRRTAGNQRIFSPADVQRLQEIKELLAQGYDLNAAAEVLQRKAAPRRMPPDTRRYPSMDWLRRRRPLDSLYPVTDHAELLRRLSRRGEERGRS